ncbi:MAG: PEP-CTERM sorting domain-containing protein [Planctomycetes bacterium]|nr:PEP-CTERM sorting domain-containing protein [Planctomycetota bacterium]
MSNRFVFALASFGFLMPGILHGAMFDPHNLLITEGNVLYEYTRAGAVVQSFPIPHPDTERYDVTDVVVDAAGNAHLLNMAPFDFDYFTALAPATGNFTHTFNPVAFFGNVSDGDLSIRGDIIVSRSVRYDLSTSQISEITVPGFGGVGEISFGLDGLLYVLDSGSPRAGVRVLDPSDSSLVREFQLRDDQGSRLDARGIAVSREGQMFVADWDGRIYEYDPLGTFIRKVPTGLNNLLDIDLALDGTLIIGSRFGDVAVTDTRLQSFDFIRVGDGLTYVGFAVVPEPSTMLLLLVGGLCCTRLLRRCRRHV